MIGNIAFAIQDVANSMNLHKHPISPMQYAWYQSCIILCVLLVMPFFVTLQTEWLAWYAVAGGFMYGAYLMFMYMIKHLDVSVINAAWVFMAIIISIVGHVVFDEFFTYMQAIGALLAVGSSCVVSFYHKHVSWWKTIVTLLFGGALYVPFYIIQKAAMLDGETALAAFYYPMMVSCLLSFAFPVFTRSFRRMFYVHTKNISVLFVIVIFISTVAGLLGTYAMTLAYQAGFASHVSITENTQPFMILILASLIGMVLPRYTPKELLTKQSVSLKIGCFTATFIGMALLAIG